MKTVGIDPGITGALAFMQEGELMTVYDMPTTKTRSGKNQVSGNLLAETLRAERPDNAKLEQVAARPGQGVTSMFNFGMGYGTVIGVLASLGIPYELVTPQAWKKAAGLVGADKDYARTKALQLYPDAELSRKKDIGRADAILIARYG